MGTFGPGILLDGHSKRPIAGKVIRVLDPVTDLPVETVETVVTDANGYYDQFRTTDITIEHVKLTDGRVKGVHVPAVGTALSEITGEDIAELRDIKTAFDEGIDTTDASLAITTNDDTSTFRQALTRNGKKPVGRDELMFNVRDYGATGDGTTPDSAAIQAAINACPMGGTVFFPPGIYRINAKLTFDKPLMLLGGVRGIDDAGRTGPTLLCDAGVGCLEVSSPTGGASKRIPWGMQGIFIKSLSTAAGTDVGIKAWRGPAIITDVAVERFGSHGIHLIAGAQVGGGNVSMSTLTAVRCYGNRGDGMKFEGTDSNQHLIIHPDVTANYGWGINHENTARCIIDAPHADQQYNGSPGAYRDNGMGNVWRDVYSELGKEFRADVNCLDVELTMSPYARPAVNILTPSVARVTVRDSQWGHRRRFSMYGASGHRFEINADRFMETAFSMRYTGDTAGTGTYSEIDFLAYIRSLNQMRVDAHLRPMADNTRDLGVSGIGWRDAFVSRHIRLGSLYLRDNAGTLEVSTNGSTWRAVTLAP